MFALAVALCAATTFVSSLVRTNFDLGPAVIVNAPMLLYPTWPLLLIVRHLAPGWAIWLVVLGSLALALAAFIRAGAVHPASYISTAAGHALVLVIDGTARRFAEIPVAWATVGTLLVLAALSGLVLWLRDR